MRPLAVRRTARSIRQNGGFTLVELIIVVVVLVVAFAILLPMIVRARERSRAAACRNQLRQIGTGLEAYAMLDPWERLCLGSFDWRRDGCPDNFSWLATLQIVMPPQPAGTTNAAALTLLCPSNPARQSAALQDLLALESGAGKDARRFDSGFCDSRSGLLSAPPQSTQRATMVENLVQQGWNTNYSASWFLVRGHPRYTMQVKDGEVSWYAVTEPDPTTRGRFRLAMSGPLTRRNIDNSDARSSLLPLMGDGHVRRTAGETGSGVVIEGAGPSAYSRKFGDVVPISESPTIPAAVLLPINQPACCGGSSDETKPRYRDSWLPEHGYLGELLQDTRHWRAVHHSALGQTANFLMADGSVIELADRDGDQLLNPGFAQWAGGERSSSGVALQRELDEFQMYTNAVLDQTVMCKCIWE